MATSWSPRTWRDRPVAQQPDWPDAGALEAVLKQMSTLPPLVFAGEARSLTDQLADDGPSPEDSVLAADEDRRITSLLDVLDTRARYAVEQRFGLNDGRKRSYREVGEELGVTAEAARRMVKRAVNTVRNEAESRIDAA